MIRIQGLCALILAAGLLLAGCSGGGSGKADSALLGEFQGAGPAVKKKVEFIIAANKTNDFVGTITTLREIAATDTLTSKQQKAIEDMLEVVMTKMSQEIDKGNPAAVKARDILQQLRRPGR